MNSTKLREILYELIWCCVQTKLRASDVVDFIIATKLAEHETMVAILTDLIWTIGQEIAFSEPSGEKHRSEEWNNLSELVKYFAVSLVCFLHFDAPLTTYQSLI